MSCVTRILSDAGEPLLGLRATLVRFSPPTVLHPPSEPRTMTDGLLPQHRHRETYGRAPLTRSCNNLRGVAISDTITTMPMLASTEVPDRR